MHNIKNIRNNFDIFKENIEKRNVKININEIIQLDKLNRELIQKKRKFRKRKKRHF